jgi:hypothetical protein
MEKMDIGESSDTPWKDLTIADIERYEKFTAITRRDWLGVLKQLRGCLSREGELFLTGMSNRTLMELNHDFCPANDVDGLLMWAKAMRLYIRTGEKKHLPLGVTFKGMRHHSDTCPLPLIEVEESE